MCGTSSCELFLKDKPTAMKTIARVLATLLCFQSFCPYLQQTRAATPRQSDGRGVVAADTPDSDAFFRAAVRQRPARDYTRRINELVARMTLEEKVGQMTQLEIGMVTAGSDQSIRIDPAKLEKAILKYGVGSILNVKDQALTVDAWHEIIRQIQAAAGRTRLKIPVIYGIDTIHGANYVQGSTLFPQEIGMAATWNPALMQRSQELAAAETRAAGIPWSFSPVLDIGRQPLWPRFYETFGEDPYLATVMGVAFVRGLEGEDVSSNKSVAASLKHYMGYSFPLNGRDRTPAWIPENYLREYFLPTFAAAVRAGARTVMVNSAEINGVPGHVNRHILTDILRGELGFKGFVVSDWEDIKKLVTQWKVAADEKEATRMSVMAGIDMSMVPSDYSFADHLVALVREGSVPMSRIDEAVRRILLVKFELGLLEPRPRRFAEGRGRAEQFARRGDTGRARVPDAPEERGGPAAARARTQGARHRPDGELARPAQQRLDVRLAGLGGVALPERPADHPPRARRQARQEPLLRAGHAHRQARRLALEQHADGRERGG
jgi:beta-glucosidase